MAMSLAIYLALLTAFVYVPTAMVEAAFPDALPVQLRLFYVVPQLQVMQACACVCEQAIFPVLYILP